MENTIESNEVESNMGVSENIEDFSGNDNLVNMDGTGRCIYAGRMVSGHKVWQDESGE